MPTKITQIDDVQNQRVVLRVEGEMTREDAILLERISRDMRNSTGSRIVLDVADLDFIDSESAPVLRRLAGEPGYEIEGFEIFLQTAVNDAERIEP
jgi:anti-anti-sigma regulatory factor